MTHDTASSQRALIKTWRPRFLIPGRHNQKQQWQCNVSSAICCMNLYCFKRSKKTKDLFLSRSNVSNILKLVDRKHMRLATTPATCVRDREAVEGRVTVWIAKMRRRRETGETWSVLWLRDIKTRLADSEIKSDNIFNLIEIRNHFVFKLPIYLSKFESRLGSEIGI